MSRINNRQSNLQQSRSAAVKQGTEEVHRQAREFSERLGKLESPGQHSPGVHRKVEKAAVVHDDAHPDTHAIRQHNLLQAQWREQKLDEQTSDTPLPFTEHPALDLLASLEARSNPFATQPDPLLASVDRARATAISELVKEMDRRAAECLTDSWSYTLLAGSEHGLQLNISRESDGSWLISIEKQPQQDHQQQQQTLEALASRLHSQELDFKLRHSDGAFV